MSNGDDELPDDQVLNRLRNERELIRVLWARYAQRVSRYLSKRVGHEAAEDLLSEVFVAALDARKRVVGHESASALPWLYGIAGNIVCQYLRVKKPAGHWLLHDPEGVDWAEVDARLDAQAQREQLRAALGALSRTDRELLLLVAWEGLSAVEAAQALGISRMAVRTRLHRARRRALHALTPGPDSDRVFLPQLLPDMEPTT